MVTRVSDLRTGAASTPAIDAAPLTAPVRSADVRAFVRDLRRRNIDTGPLVTGSWFVFIVVFALFALVFGGVAFTIAGEVVAYLLPSGTVEQVWTTTWNALPIVAVVLVLGGVLFWALDRRPSRAERWYRLDSFARANGMSYLPRVVAPSLPGLIFTQGDSRQALDVVRGARPRLLEFANYRYVTGSGKERSQHKWGYVAVKLDVPLPHIVLDAIGNNGLFGSNLPIAYTRDQRLKLEGDFDRYFALSCPAGYERDALYLFTPDIMARFIDNAAALDVEIVDDWLFLYAKRDFSTLDPATWAWLFSVVAALLDKLDQWARWRDDRTDAASAPTSIAAASLDAAPLQPPAVAAGGRRLRRGIRIGPFLFAGALLALWLLVEAGVIALPGG
jgi:hypothetical protein